MGQKLKKLWLVLKSYLPTALPQTPAAFDIWATSILALGALPDNDSFRNALATRLMHVPETTTKVPKQFFLKILQKSITNQMAYEVIDAIRSKRKNEQQILQNGAIQEA